MKKCFHNLKALLAASESSEIFDSYKRINDMSTIANHELNDILEVSKRIVSLAQTKEQLFGYIFDKTVTVAVREQFDILRFSENSILNIELKSGIKPLPEILDQLVRHHYLLSCVSEEREIYLFTYVSESNILYELVDGDLKESSFDRMVSLISTNYVEEDSLSKLKADDFIISPYSDIKRFNRFKYFLNTEQRRFVTNRIENIDSRYHCMLKGGAGTGKSLVLFDLSKKLTLLGKKVLFIFCSALPDYKIIDSNVTFKFVDIVHINIEKIKNEYDFIILDESQRLYKRQFNDLFQTGSVLVFGVDKAQTLKEEEDKLDVEGTLDKHFSKENIFDLKDKVRTDVSLSTFILKFFNKSTNGLQPIDFPKVNAVYFSDKREAIKFIHNLETLENYIPIEVAQYRARSTDILHNERIYVGSLDGFKVIGREYDNVLIPLDSRISYEDNKLIFSPTGYFPYKSNNGLFQALTRVKKNLMFVVIDNPTIYKEIQKVINWQIDKKRNIVSERLIRLRSVNGFRITDIAKSCKIRVETYENIEKTGIFPNNKILTKLANFYNIDSDFILGDPIELSSTDFDILYKQKSKSLSDLDKKKLNEELLRIIEEF